MKKILISMLICVGCAGNREASTRQQLCTQNPNDPCCPGSPVVVDTAGDGINLTSAEDGVVFTLRTGQLGLWAWTERGADDAFLVLDVNGNGRIDDGTELFGDASMQVASNSPSGFMALAYYDDNGDGVVDSRDKIWSRLRLWRDVDHDAFSASDELQTLDAAGVHSFSLAAVSSEVVDAHGNESRFTSTIVADPPVSTTVSDVWLSQTPLPVDRVGGVRDSATWTCYSWGYAVTGTGPLNPVRQMCDNATTANDPIATSYGGQLTKLVARWSTSVSKATAMRRSHEIVFDAIVYIPVGPSGYLCSSWSFPEPDLYYLPPYDDDGYAWSTQIRTKCFYQTVPSGGGGC